MHKVIVLGFALAIAVSALAVTSTVGSAQVGPKLVQTDCDTLSFNPPRVHVKFAVINLSPIPVCSIHMIPIASGPYPPCEVFECSHPDGWECQLNAAAGADWRAVPGVPCIAPFEKLENFDVILDPPYCCYRVAFDGPNGEIFGEDVFCFQCESPTPAKPSTWGSLKVLYR
jgi:hypothetical protein